MEKVDYIVIGSGIAGLHTAYRLSQQDKKVLVLEKESYIGGRMSSHEIDGNFVDFGAKFIAPNLYKNMGPLAKELGVEPMPINITKAGIMKEGQVYALDGEKRLGAALDYKGISFRGKIRLTLGMLYTFIKYRKLSMYNWHEALYLDDKSVYDDFRKIVGAEGFDHAIELFSQDVVFYPTKKMSRAVLYPILAKLARMKGYTFPRGIGHLCEIMAAKLPVETGVEVESVQRTSNGVLVKATKNAKELTYEAKNAIVAVPGSRVLDILADPLPEEKEFFFRN
jgi:protoporphyrinogen oxidase